MNRSARGGKKCKARLSGPTALDIKTTFTFFHDCTAVVLQRHGGDGGATAVLVRCHGGHGGATATPLRIGPTRGGTAEVLNMFKVSAVPPRRSAVLTVFRGATAMNDGTIAEPRRSWRCHCSLCHTSTAVAPHLRFDGGITLSIT